MNPARLAFALGAALSTGPVLAGTQIVACVVATLEGNGSYYGAATTTTKLKCELADPDYFPTLVELYAEGWRLIEVVGGNHAIAMGHQGPSPLYLLERDESGPAARNTDGPAAAD
jgi:hypothetical protein